MVEPPLRWVGAAAKLRVMENRRCRLDWTGRRPRQPRLQSSSGGRSARLESSCQPNALRPSLVRLLAVPEWSSWFRCPGSAGHAPLRLQLCYHGFCWHFCQFCPVIQHGWAGFSLACPNLAPILLALPQFTDNPHSRVESASPSTSARRKRRSAPVPLTARPGRREPPAGDDSSKQGGEFCPRTFTYWRW